VYVIRASGDLGAGFETRNGAADLVHDAVPPRA
jgi:hypothetical protein